MSNNSCDQMFLFLREVCCTIATYMHTLRACIKCTEQTEGETEGEKTKKQNKTVLNHRGYPAATSSTVPRSLLQPVSPNTIRNSKDRVLSLGSSAPFCVRYYKSGNYSYQTG